MARKTGNMPMRVFQTQTYKCSVCGATLYVDQRNIPVTSLYKNNRWICGECMRKPDPKERHG